MGRSVFSVVWTCAPSRYKNYSLWTGGPQGLIRRYPPAPIAVFRANKDNLDNLDVDHRIMSKLSKYLDVTQTFRHDVDNLDNVDADHGIMSKTVPNQRGEDG